MSENQFTHDFAATTGVQDFKLRDTGPPPPGYPTSAVPDDYTRKSRQEAFEDRQQNFIEFALNNPGADSVKGFFLELIRISEGKSSVHERMLFAALDYIEERRDCADFVLNGVLRILYQLHDSELLPDGFLGRARTIVLGFKYWPDEPGVDSMCYWTENHHIIFSTCEFLAGQMFPNDTFTNSGTTGAYKAERAAKRIRKWLELRFFTGFNEWLSNVYYDEDFPPLLNLVDFAEDEEIVSQARGIVDLMLFDMASNSYYGQFSCTHGRIYTREKLHPRLESTADTSKLMFGLGHYANVDNMSAVFFALSSYRMPPVIYTLAQQTGNGAWENRQRVSIKFSEAEKWGYGEMNLESAMGLLSFAGYSHPHTFNHLVLMLDKFNWWENQFFQEFAPFRKIIDWGKHIKLTTLVAWVLRKDMSRNALEEANLYTFRTPDYMLSTAQDYRKSFGGDQHHIWQATLDDEAVCFTTHPGGYGEKAPDAYWHGNGFMPRALQHRNVAIVLYNTPRTPNVVLARTLEFTHAFFPRDRFDEVVESRGWIFGRRNNGYIALYCSNEWQWQTEGEYKDQEVIAQGRRCAWITEMGSAAAYGSFESFVERISASPISVEGLKVIYPSPLLGVVKAGWSGALNVDGVDIVTSDYPRYDNPSCRARFGSGKIEICRDGQNHTVSRQETAS